MSTKRCALVRSSVLLTLRRASQISATSSLSELSNAWNSASFLANAYASLPVVFDIFLGGATPSSRNTFANWSLLASADSSILIFSKSVSRFSRSSAIASFSMSLSSCSVGLVNILSVMSISLSSLSGNPPSTSIVSFSNTCSQSHTSCLQYSASSCSTSGGRNSKPSLLFTDVPLGGKP